VSFSVGHGEVHALVGENGAGKSTLIKILAGEHRQDAGTIQLNGVPVDAGHAWERRSLGLAFIHQIPAQVGSLSIAENIVLSEGFRATRFGLIPWKTQYTVAREALAKVGLAADPKARLDTLSVAERQLVAVAAALVRKHKVVVFDEPTASLTESETERLFGLIRAMRNDGVAILYVSHRLEEIFALADKVTVMKDGRHVTTTDVASLDQAALTSLIIGKESTRQLAASQRATTPGADVLQVVDLRGDLMHGISFSAREGEVLGLAGLAGAGRSNVLLSLFGSSDAKGRITFHGEELVLKHPADAISKGIVMVTEERQLDGFIPEFSIWQTITLPWLRRFSRFGWLSTRDEVQSATASMRRFDVRASSPSSPMSSLSGGNQQKAILARWLSQDIRLVLLDEPTHGVDIGAKNEIYELVGGIAQRNIPVIVVSSELEELERLCTRVLLLVRGEIVGEMSGAEITKSNMLTVLLGARPANNTEVGNE
jgi:ABC-type sugar transport system ATPase subunit